MASKAQRRRRYLRRKKAKNSNHPVWNTSLVPGPPYGYKLFITPLDDFIKEAVGYLQRQESDAIQEKVELLKRLDHAIIRDNAEVLAMQFELYVVATKKLNAIWKELKERAIEAEDEWVLKHPVEHQIMTDFGIGKEETFIPKQITPSDLGTVAALMQNPQLIIDAVTSFIGV